MHGTRDTRRFTGRGVRGMLSAILMVLAAATVIQIAKALNVARDTLASTAPLVVRSIIQDRLIGSRVPATVFSGTIGNGPVADGEPPLAHLLWIVDLDNCHGCLRAGISWWNALSRDPTLGRHLVVSGDTTGLGPMMRAPLGTDVKAAPADEIASALGLLLPNTQLLIDGEGIIVMADSRTTGSDCGWSFAAQVGSLRGTLTSELIRK